MNHTRWLTHAGVLSALSVVLMFFSIPLPFLPDFLRLDLAELPALVGLFTLGPLGAIAIEVIKNLVHLIGTRTFAIGELANFLIGSSLILGTYIGIRFRWSLWASLVVGVFCMTLCGAVVNLFILLPLYAWVLGVPLDAFVKIGKAANPRILDLTGLILWAIVPFNLVKGSVIAAVAAVILPRLKGWNEERQ